MKSQALHSNLKNVNKIDTLEAYYEELVKKATDKDKERFSNRDRAHNAIVMRVMLEKANNIRMYCGKLSVFRKSFADKVYESIDYEENPDSNFDPIKGLYEALANYLKKGNNLEAIIENPQGLEEEDIYKNILRKYIDKGQVSLYTIKNNSKKPLISSHFTLGDDYMYRRENNRTERSAICSFNSYSGVEILSWQFNSYKKDVVPIH